MPGDRRAWWSRDAETPTARTLVCECSRLGRPPGRPARRRAADRRGRLPGRRGATRWPRRPTAIGSRSPCSGWPDGEVSPYLADELDGRRPGGGARAARRLVRLATRRHRPGAAGRRRLRHRAADGDDPGPRRRGQPGAVPAALLGPHPGGPHLRRRAAPTGRGGRRPRRDLACTPGPPRTAIRDHRAGSARRRPGRPRAGRPTSSRPATSAARPASSRRSPTCWSPSGHDPARIRTERFGWSVREEGAMTMESTYDGNVLAGPLSEVFAADVTSAIARCRGCGRSSVVADARCLRPRPWAGGPVPRL